MQIAQDRQQPGCVWALAAALLALTWLVPTTGINADLKFATSIAFVVGLVLYAIYLTVDQRIYPNSVLVIDAPPEPDFAEELRLL